MTAESPNEEAFSTLAHDMKSKGKDTRTDPESRKWSGSPEKK